MSTLIETIYLKIRAHPLPKNEKRPLRVAVRRSKTPLLDLFDMTCFKTESKDSLSAASIELAAKTLFQNNSLENQSYKNKHNIKVNLLSGDRRKSESYLSSKADIVTKTRNHRTEEAWLISLNSGISSFFVKRLIGVNIYPSMHSGITMMYNMTRTSLAGKDS